MPEEITLSSRWVAVFGLTGTGSLGAQRRGSVNAGVTPRVGPPPPITGPSPPSAGAAGGAVFTGSGGSVDGTDEGETSGAGAGLLFVARLSPPARCFEAVSAAVRTYCTCVSSGFSADASSRIQPIGTIATRTSTAIATMCRATETTMLADPRRAGSARSPGVVIARRRVLLTGPARSRESDHRTAHLRVPHDLHLHHVVRCERPHTGRRSCQHQIIGMQRNVAGNKRQQRGNREDQIGRRSPLALLAVHSGYDRERGKIVRLSRLFAERKKRIGALGACP